MNEPTAITVVTTNVQTIAAQTVFEALSEPTRRQILVALADGEFHAVTGMGGPYSKDKDLLRKHRAVLVKAGLIVAQDDPSKPRRSRFRLSPAVKAETTPTGRTLDFGCCLLRC